VSIRCPHCGLRLPVDLGPMQRRLYDIASRGATYKQVIEALWGDDPGGGPIRPNVNLSLLKTALNKKIACHGQYVSHATGFYWLSHRLTKPVSLLTAAGA
jgi:hypothetical protein